MDKYIAVVQKEDDSAFGAYFPDLPGCYAAGDSEDEALGNLQISLRMYAEDFVEAGKALPSARSLKEIAADREVKVALSDSSGFLVMVPLLFADSKRRVNVMLEPSLIAAVDEAAKISGTNRSDYLAKAAWREVKEATGAVRVGATRTSRRSKKAKAKKSSVRARAPRVREYA